MHAHTKSQVLMPVILRKHVISTREVHFMPASDDKTKNKEVLEDKVAQHSKRNHPQIDSQPG